MTTFTVHTQETAPQGSQSTLEGVKKAYGFIPNLMGTLSESPAAVEGYATLTGIFDKTELSAAERQIVLMTNNFLNDCTYCMAAHTTVSQMQSVPADVIEALRNGTAIADTKLEALRLFTVKVFETRGFVDQADMDAFLAAGYTKANILDVILGTSLKVISNYTNHVAQTPVDEAFKANTWSKEQASAA